MKSLISIWQFLSCKPHQCYLLELKKSLRSKILVQQITKGLFMLVYWKITLTFRLHPRVSFISKEISLQENVPNGNLDRVKLYMLVQTQDKLQSQLKEDKLFILNLMKCLEPSMKQNRDFMIQKYHVLILEKFLKVASVADFQEPVLLINQ